MAVDVESLTELINRNSHNFRMRNTVSNFDALDIVCEPYSMLILKVNWELEVGPERQIYSIVSIHHL